MVRVGAGAASEAGGEVAGAGGGVSAATTAVAAEIEAAAAAPSANAEPEKPAAESEVATTMTARRILLRSMLEPRFQVKLKAFRAVRRETHLAETITTCAAVASLRKPGSPMQKLRYVPISALVGALILALAGCDGTVTGIGRVPRPPEPPLPPAPVETVDPANPAGPPAQEAQPEEISAQHLLVMYLGSKSAPSSVKRTREEARARAGEALDAVKRGQDFDKVVSTYTDEPGGAARRGRLGRFTRDRMVKAFSDAAFALEVGEVSAVIESPFGFHVIRRLE